MDRVESFMDRVGSYMVIILIFMVLFIHFYLLFFSGLQPLHIRKNVKKGIPYIFQSDEDYFAEIDRIRVTDDYVYALYSTKAIVKVYRHDGTYLGTIAIHKKTSGGTQLYTDNKRAYIERDDCIYEFNGIEFIYCYTIENGDHEEKLKQIKKIAIPAKDYSFRFGNLIKYEGTPQEHVIINRDFLHKISSQRFLFLIEFCIVISLIICAHTALRRK